MVKYQGLNSRSKAREPRPPPPVPKIKYHPFLNNKRTHSRRKVRNLIHGKSHFSVVYIPVREKYKL